MTIKQMINLICLALKCAIVLLFWLHHRSEASCYSSWKTSLFCNVSTGVILIGSDKYIENKHINKNYGIRYVKTTKTNDTRSR